MILSEKCTLGCRHLFITKRDRLIHEASCCGLHKHRLFLIAGICVYCREHIHHHADDKCLYESTQFKSVSLYDGCDECVRHAGTRPGRGFGYHSRWGDYCNCVLGQVVKQVDP